MATPTDIERISYGGSKGSLQLGAHRNVIQGVGATRTLAAKESGSLCLFDRAAGNIYTLPVPVEGMQFEFRVSVLQTSGANEIKTNSAAVFIGGSVMIGSLTVAESADVFQADPAATVKVTTNATTSGGLVGGSIWVTAISATVWSITGSLVGSGTTGTPFA